MIVENGVTQRRRHLAAGRAGLFVRNPALVDPAAKAIADKYRTAVAPIANRVVGTITADIVRDARPSRREPAG